MPGPIILYDIAGVAEAQPWCHATWKTRYLLVDTLHVTVTSDAFRCSQICPEHQGSALQNRLGRVPRHRASLQEDRGPRRRQTGGRIPTIHPPRHLRPQHQEHHLRLRGHRALPRQGVPRHPTAHPRGGGHADRRTLGRNLWGLPGSRFRSDPRPRLIQHSAPCEPAVLPCDTGDVLRRKAGRARPNRQ